MRASGRLIFNAGTYVPWPRNVQGMRVCVGSLSSASGRLSPEQEHLSTYRFSFKFTEINVDILMWIDHFFT